MDVYYIISYDIEDIDKFQQYPPEAVRLITRYGGKVLVSDTEAITIEGKSKNMNAIVKFPSKEAALNCYNDPEYQEAKKLRLASTSNCTMVLAKELMLDA